MMSTSVRSMMCCSAMFAIAAHATGGELQIILEGRLFRVQEQQFQRHVDIAKLIERRRPESVAILVCISAKESSVIELQKTIETVHAGGLRIERMPKKAVECSQSVAKERMWAT